MSAATSETNPRPGDAPQKQKRKARGKNKKQAATKKTNGASASSAIHPTAERMAAMNARTKAATSSPESIAAGYANTLLSAGPNWTEEYQKQFLAGLTASLPVICGAPA